MHKIIQNTFLAVLKCKQMEEGINQKHIMINIICMTSRETKGCWRQDDLC